MGDHECLARDDHRQRWRVHHAVNHIVVGPFTGEVGYELLYWLPYLRWKLRGQFQSALAITRGGAGLWYPCRTLDAYDLIGFDRYRELFAERIEQRNTSKSEGPNDPLDAAILGDMTPDIHPSEIITVKSRKQLPQDAKDWPHERLPTPPRLEGLPDRYVAAKLYKSAALTSGRIAQEAIDKQTLPVVVVKNSTKIDDHQDFSLEATITLETNPRESLEVLSRVVAHADHFIGTYGGTSYLGPLYGIPTTSVSDNARLVMNHSAQEARMKAQLTKENPH